MSAWNRDSTEALAVVQKQRIAQLEIENARLLERIAELREQREFWKEKCIEGDLY